MRKLYVIGLALALALTAVASSGCCLLSEPPKQAVQEAAVEKAEPSPTINLVSAEELNEILGDGSWDCFSGTDTSVYANLVTTATVSHPVTAIDLMGKRYGEGEEVPPEGAVTVWLEGKIDRHQCPAKWELPTFKDVCTVEDLSQYGTVEVKDVESGQAFVTADSMFVVPNGWTVDYLGEKYTEGTLLPSGAATWWAPPACKPLQ